MDLHGKKIILGSSSPRRRELLAGLNIDFEVDTRNDFVESFTPDTSHAEIPVLMSKGKSHGFHRPLEADEILITADTMVFCEGFIMGKPRSREEAVRMLEELSGREHQVTTAVTLRDVRREITFTDTSNVFFKEWTPEEIGYYVDTFRPYDKAGAYGIQEWIGYAGITRIEGSYFNIVGLPVHRVYAELQAFLQPVRSGRTASA